MDFSLRLDSLVRSRNYEFFPRMMYSPISGTHIPLQEGYYLGVYVDLVAVHLPYEDEYKSRFEELNFQTSTLVSYQAIRHNTYWFVGIQINNQGEIYQLKLQISRTNGMVDLILFSPRICMNYRGVMWAKWDRLQSDYKWLKAKSSKP